MGHEAFQFAASRGERRHVSRISASKAPVATGTERATDRLARHFDTMHASSSIHQRSLGAVRPARRLTVRVAAQRKDLDRTATLRQLLAKPGILLVSLQPPRRVGEATTTTATRRRHRCSGTLTATLPLTLTRRAPAATMACLRASSSVQASTLLL